MLVVTNHGATAVEAPVGVHAPSEVLGDALRLHSPECAGKSGASRGVWEGSTVTVPAFGACIITWDTPPTVP